MIIRCLSLLALFSSVSVLRADVSVELLEGTFRDKSWDLSAAKVTATWTEPAFGFVAVPGKFNEKGLELDRANPHVVRASQNITLPAGEYRLLLRSRGASRLYVDDKLVLETAFITRAADGHGSVPPEPNLEKGLRYPLGGQQSKFGSVALDGKQHAFRFEFFVGHKELRPEVGEPAVAIAPVGQPFHLLAEKLNVPFSDEGWAKYAAQAQATHYQRDQAARGLAQKEELAYWHKRHEAARAEWKDKPAIAIPDVPKSMPVHNEIDRFIGAKLIEQKLTPVALTDDDTFLRRVTLDTVGVIPSPEEIEAFRKDASSDKRSKVIDRLLNDPRWADHWTSYWQDVLAENPGLLKPTLNNTGPFRFWVWQALVDNMPMDRFATELTMMEGSSAEGGPAGFAIATENDLPMAAKAQTLAKAFLASDLTCSRCHDGPSKSFTQEELFGFAAMLGRAPIAVPATSTVKVEPGTRVPAIKITLKPGQKVAPDWKLDAIAPDDLPTGVLRKKDDSREKVAAVLTSPRNERFAQVLVNRVWKRWFGLGLVEPVDNWFKTKPTHPELLSWLGRELITHDYDMKHVARLMLNSHAYQRVVGPTKEQGEAQWLAAQNRRRLSAEQLVDSLFAAAGKTFDCEELTFDPDGRQPPKQCINLGVPKRAWGFVALANERDRPALALPMAQSIVDVLQAYGWRDTRTTSLTEREEAPLPLQPMTLANGILHNRIARVSDESAFTELALSKLQLSELVEKVFDRTLTRRPTDTERVIFTDLLSAGYAERLTGKPPAEKKHRKNAVSWANHLSPEATNLKLELEALARAGDPPTPRLKDEWRKRYEDMLWTLMNSPEFAFAP